MFLLLFTSTNLQVWFCPAPFQPPVLCVCRYMVILHPLKPRMKHQTAYILVLMVWIVPILISVPSAYMASEFTFPHMDGLPPKTLCAQIWPMDHQVLFRSYYLLVFALEFVCPVIIMAVCYIKISRELWFKDVPGFQTEQIRKRLQKRRRTVVVLVLVLVAYVLCWAPYWGFALLRDFHPTLITRGRHSLVAFYVTECIAMSNGIINTLCFVSVRNSTKHLKKAGKFPLKLVTFVAAKSVDEGEAQTLSLRVTEDTEGTAAASAAERDTSPTYFSRCHSVGPCLSDFRTFITDDFDSYLENQRRSQEVLVLDQVSSDPPEPPGTVLLDRHEPKTFTQGR